MADETTPNQTAPETTVSDPLETVRADLKTMREGFEQERQKWAEERQQYAQMLGQQIAQQRAQQQPLPTATTTTDPDPYFDADTAQQLRAIAQREAESVANRVAYGLLGRAQVLQEVGSNTELEKLAQEELRNIANNPFYLGMSNDHKLALAVKEAQIKFLRKQQVTSQQTALHDAAQAQAQGANLPGTQVAGGQGTQAKTKEEYVKEFSADAENRAFVKRWVHVDPDTPRGQAELRKAAEANWAGIAFAGTLGKAIEILGGKQ